jgi:hypothetical protein
MSISYDDLPFITDLPAEEIRAFLNVLINKNVNEWVDFSAELSWTRVQQRKQREQQQQQQQQISNINHNIDNNINEFLDTA